LKSTTHKPTFSLSFSAAIKEIAILRGHKGGLWSAAFSPDGRASSRLQGQDRRQRQANARHLLRRMSLILALTCRATVSAYQSAIGGKPDPPQAP
jgi:hypothetical protein